ncbi:MAG TPA: VCBS repeat-containing protein [Puia sp.]|nr:VCBS repeat-containing protein [Puia sp.]
MRHFKGVRYFIFLLLYGALPITGCKQKPALPVLFEIKDDKSTGLHFANNLTPTQDFNVFDYMYFFNGAGVGAGDFNNDGKIDLFFAASQGDNQLYLNEGNLQFKNVTKEAMIPEDGGWSTGVSVVDINNDGLLDIYICRVGDYEALHSRNQLLICQGIDKNGVPYYKDEAKEYGLDFSGFSTQAVFFDYDGDGDLDMYLLNHSIHQNGTYGVRNDLLNKAVTGSGDHIFRNDGNGHFTDVTKETGINSSILGYGLGITVADIDMDGYPDIYIGNDFHENDYMYINQRNGTFKDELNKKLMHTSRYTMGVDVADATNDGFPEIISMDMLPYDPYILKRSEGEDTYDIFNLKIGLGFNYQYTRNNLQYNRRNGMFSEVGLYAGVAATDWSWSPLWFDFDNDGLKDLFVSNGIPRRMNDIDFIDFISNQEIQEKMRSPNKEQKDLDLIDRSPQIKIPNRFFKNNGEMSFTDLGDRIGNEKSTYSNGAVYADFDNDGDLDVVVNNIDEPAMLYENKSADNKSKAFVEIKLKGPAQNINAVGSKIIIYANDGIRTYEKFPVRGFLSSSEIPIHIGLDKAKVDSAFLIWPDNSYQSIKLEPLDTIISFGYQKGLPKFDYDKFKSFYKNPTRPVEDITAKTGIQYRHKENTFHEFDLEPLMPHMLSTEGPGLTVADFNHDGLDDVFIGASKNGKSAVYLQQKSGKFLKTVQPAFETDTGYEYVASCAADINNDGFPDLITANGGNEYSGQNEHLRPRIFLNDGKGNFNRDLSAFDSIFVNAVSIASMDINGDGFPDLFIGGRSVPLKYGQIPRSYLLLNNGKGKFIDVTDKLAPGLSHIGFVTSSLWYDIDQDGQKDLLLSLEWGGIVAFINHNGSFVKKELTDKKGWWNFILPVDLDHNGKIDLIVGNLGLNSRLKASEKEPVRLYYYDFDGNGKKDQILSYYINGRELPFANKNELQKQIPSINKKFLYAADFAKASFTDIFPREDLDKADVFTANYFSNAVLMNRGDLKFDVVALPWEAQLSSYRDAVVIDANHDSLPDILLVGNYYENNIQMGRYDADFGTILMNHGNGSFSSESLNGLQIRGEVRHIKKLNVEGREAFILARNNDSTMVIQFKN